MYAKVFKVGKTFGHLALFIFSLVFFLVLFHGEVRNVFQKIEVSTRNVLTDKKSTDGAFTTGMLSKDPTAKPRSKELAQCTKGNDLVGPLFVDQTKMTWEQLKKELDHVKDGGYYEPENCKPVVKTAIIIPYRDREEHLKIFLRQIHPMLKRQNLVYEIFVVEQADANEFNRGKLMNVGYVEAIKRSDFNCFVFHDVDLIPENDRNYYGCHMSPAHLSVAVDKFNYELLYETLFGGVVMFTEKDFKKINGFSNIFWGWGAEDDNLYERVTQHGLRPKRPAIEKARYTMIRHKDAPLNKERFKILDKAGATNHKDGLNSLQYEVIESVNHNLYTKVSVDLLKNKQDMKT